MVLVALFMPTPIYREYSMFIVSTHCGGLGAEPAFSETSCGAPTQEAGKSPTEVPRGRRLPVAPPSAISEYVSPSSYSWSLNRALLAKVTEGHVTIKSYPVLVTEGHAINSQNQLLKSTRVLRPDGCSGAHSTQRMMRRSQMNV